ncbi:hypothetical protein [uncultured Lacinutrix sp.]|uniref:hypothetical protein n=1 Tax=uncultured Lacinutrix sp. TaxID=574032 RepID=UPI002617FA22|nr:hypothetical protein [uncultured Lacinutrix sp.]
MTEQSHIDIGVGYITIHENYLVVIINKDETVTIETNKILLDLVDLFYQNKNFVYISNRKNSYAVNPTVYFETKKIKNLIGFAVVSQKEITKNNALIEKLFVDKPFKIFKELNEATSWANSLVLENKKRVTVLAYLSENN